MHAVAGKNREEEDSARSVAEVFSKTSGLTREQLSGIISLLPCYVVLIGADFRVRFHNKALMQVFDKVEGKLCYEVLHTHAKSCPECRWYWHLPVCGGSVSMLPHHPHLGGAAFYVELEMMTE